jgi:hypothetical protein
MHRGQLVEDRRQNSWRTHLSGRVLEGKNQASFFGGCGTQYLKPVLLKLKSILRKRSQRMSDVVNFKFCLK